MSSQEPTSRERVLMTLGHKEPDRLPFDLGGTQVTGIHVTAYRRLRSRLELPAKEPTIYEVVQQVAVVDEDLADRLSVDVRGACSAGGDGFTATDDGAYLSFVDAFGIGWRMPKDNGMYFDMFHHPLSGAISVDDVDRFPWPDPDAWDAQSSPVGDLLALRQRIVDIRERQQRAVAIESPLITGPVETFLWLRGFEDGYADLAIDQRLASRIMERVVEIKLRYWKQVLDAVGDVVDVVVETDDLGGQNQMLMSIDTYRKVIKPMHRKLFDFIHANTDARVFLHSCGAIHPVIGDLIEVGVDILNPIQVNAAGMDPRQLKREFGDDLVFWGGGVDSQGVFGAGSPDEVREEVKRRLHDLMPGGGFVFAAIHNIQGDVPEENIYAMCQAVQDYGKY